MNFRRKITLSLFLTIVLGAVAFAQVVDIPDPNLRAAITEAQGHGHVSRDTLRALKGLDATGLTIANLSGLEFAVNMEWLFIGVNQITDLGPLSDMEQLETLHIYTNPISDISPLENLANLKYLNASGCNIVDISPLANLSELIHLHLSWNGVTDISALANLTNLELLKLRNNPIVEYGVLHGLSIDYVEYDQACDMPPLPLPPRLSSRTFPSVFSAWGEVANQPHLSGIQRFAQHDLYFTDDVFYQQLLDTGHRWELRSPISESTRIRDDYLSINPNMIFLIEISMRDLDKTRFPEDSAYWVKGAHGKPVSGTQGTYLLDFTNADVQDMIVGQALAVERCGLYDGVFFDWWSERYASLADESNWNKGGYVSFEGEQRAQDIILERIRAESRPNFLILVNTGRFIIPRNARHINGSFMETLTPSVDYKGSGARGVEEGLSEVESALTWLEANLREPRINSLEGWGFPDESPTVHATDAGCGHLRRSA